MCSTPRTHVAGDVLIADAVPVEEAPKLSILLGNSPGSHLDFGGGLDTLQLIDP